MARTYVIMACPNEYEASDWPVAVAATKRAAEAEAKRRRAGVLDAHRRLPGVHFDLPVADAVWERYTRRDAQRKRAFEKFGGQDEDTTFYVAPVALIGPAQ